MMSMNGNSMLPEAKERIQEKLPAYMDFTSKDLSPAAENSRYFVSPSNGNVFVSSAVSGPIISFSIPCGTPATYLNTLETALVFTIQNATNQPMTLDAGGALAIVESVDVYFGSSHISSIQGYGNMVSVLSDFNSYGNQAVRGVADLVLPATYTAAAGQSALKSRVGVTLAVNDVYTVSVPLVNCLGTLAQKALPIGSLKDTIHLDIRLSGGLSWGTYPAIPATSLYTIINPRLWLTQIRIDGAVENALLASLPNGIINIPVFDVQSFSTSVAANCGSFSYQIPIKCSSLTSVIVTMRENATLGKFNYSELARTKGNLESFRFRIGTMMIPSVPIDCTGSGCEARLEVQRLFNQLSASESPTYIDNALYNAQGAAGGSLGPGVPGAFAFGLNLSAFSMAEILSDGRNVRNEYITLDCKMVTSVSQALTVNVYCFQEKLLVAQGGLLSYSD